MIKKTLFIILLLYMPFSSIAQCWAKVAAGGYHTLAIKTDGTLWAWGRNNFGQLGIGNTIDKNVPTQVGNDTDWLEIDASFQNTMAQKTNGTLWAWGNNSYGQIGNGIFGFNTFIAIPTQIGNDTDWIKFSSAGNNTYAIKSNGTLWGWGSNNRSNQSELGTGDVLPHYTPFQIGTDSDWREVESRGNFALALKNNNSLWGWGNNFVGALGIGLESTQITVPTQTGNNTSDWAQVAVGYCCDTKLIKTNGSLWAMGSGSLGNIGNGNNVIVNNNPTQIGTDTNWIKVVTGDSTCAIKSDNSFWVWGSNVYGQLGISNNSNSNVPINVTNSLTWLINSSSRYNIASISNNNTLYSWGLNNYGQLGDGTNIDKNISTLIGSVCSLKTSNFDNLQKLKLYPNPSNNFTTLDYSLLENETATISITNNLGQVVYNLKNSGVLGNNNSLLDTSNLCSGVYIVTLETANIKSSCKLVKQ